ncbi:MAG: hypothetical protein DWB45_12655 [Xanthomonadales bacterium]|nr:hypothetical protein [Xanthomonadales bacterium]
MPDEFHDNRGDARRNAPATASSLRRLHADRGGMVTLEHALLLAAFTLPMYLVLDAMLDNLGTYYAMLTFFGSIPFF